MRPASPREPRAGKGVFSLFSAFVVGLLFVALAAAPAAAETVIASIDGVVEIMRQGTFSWTSVKAGDALEIGDQLRTAGGGRAEVVLQDGSRVRLGPRSSFTVDRVEKESFSMKLGFGSLKAWVKHIAGRQFDVRTPTAVCSVRGTEFGVDVDPSSQRTQVDLYRGLLGVQDNKGNSLLLHEGQRLTIDRQGLGVPVKITDARGRERQGDRRTLRAEVGLAMSKEAVLAAAAQEIKLAEYQQGKALVDVNGNRVRLEEYIIRPAPDQFKLVVLDERQASLNYFFYHGFFNTTLPTDLSIALRQLSGTPDAAPRWYLTEYRTGRSNTVDSVAEHAFGGHPVDVNHDGVPADAVTSYFDAGTNQFVNLLPGEKFYKTLFDYYRIWYNPADPANPAEPTALTPFPQGLTYRWDPAGSVTPFNGTPGTGIQNMGADIATTILGGSSGYDLSVTLPDGTLLHQRLKETYGTGDYTQYDNYIIDNNGSLAQLSDFSGTTTGPAFVDGLLKWNFEQVITSSFFNGRKIDLVIEPRIMVQSGLSGFSQ